MTISDEPIYLEILSPDNVGNEYVEWMKDEETVKYLKTKLTVYTLDILKEYVKNMNESQNDFLFGILLKDSHEYIGNLKIGGINQIHRHGNIGLILGNKKHWGKGYGSEAIRIATRCAFENLNLNKLYAGINSKNVACYKAFLKADYKEVARLQKHLFFKGKYVDSITVERCRELNDVT